MFSFASCTSSSSLSFPPHAFFPDRSSTTHDHRISRRSHRCTKSKTLSRYHRAPIDIDGICGPKKKEGISQFCTTNYDFTPLLRYT